MIPRVVSAYSKYVSGSTETFTTTDKTTCERSLAVHIVGIHEIVISLRWFTSPLVTDRVSHDNTRKPYSIFFCRRPYQGTLKLHAILPTLVKLDFFQLCTVSTYNLFMEQIMYIFICWAVSVYSFFLIPLVCIFFILNVKWSFRCK